MDIKKVERVSALSRKVMDSKATVLELNEYRSLLRKWTTGFEGLDTKTRPSRGLGDYKK